MLLNDQIILSNQIRDAVNESPRADIATIAGIMFNWQNSPGNLGNDGDA